MIKNKLILAAFTFSFAVFFGLQANAGNVRYTADGDITLSGSGITVQIKSGSQADTIEVGTTSFDVTVSAPDTLSVESTDRYTLSNNGSYATQCFSNVSQLSIVPSGTQTVTITPSTTSCGTTTSSSGGTGQASSGGGGGGGGAAPAPTPVVPPTGQVTSAVSVNGGSVAISNTDGGSLTVQVPNGAVSSNTNFTAVSSAVSGTPSVLIPATLSTVAGRFYEITASTTSGSSISNFNQPLTLMFSYTDAQIASLNESGLKIHYWDGVKWVALSSTVNAATNTISATVTHLTMFAIFGTKSVAVVTSVPTTTTTTTTISTPALTLIRVKGDFKVYVIESGKRRWIKTAEEFAKGGYDWKKITEINASELGSYPEVESVVSIPTASTQTPTLIRLAGNHRVYVIENGKRRWIKTAQEFIAAGYDWKKITDVSVGQFAAYSEVSEANVKIAIGTLNVRSLPSLKGKILTKVRKNSVYPIVSEQQDWIKIKLSNGTEGWVFSQYIVKQ